MGDVTTRYILELQSTKRLFNKVSCLTVSHISTFRVLAKEVTTQKS